MSKITCYMYDCYTVEYITTLDFDPILVKGDIFIYTLCQDGKETLKKFEIKAKLLKTSHNISRDNQSWLVSTVTYYLEAI